MFVSMKGRTAVIMAGVMAGALTLAACGGGDRDGTASPEPSRATVADILEGDGQLSRMEALIKASGLEAVLDGEGPYTVFAPVDAAFGAADGAAAPDGAEAAALLRAHMAPGAMTRTDIETALDADGAGKVEVRTMDGGLLTLTRDGEAIRVTGADGVSATLTGEEAAGANGVIQRVDALLVPAAGG